MKKKRFHQKYFINKSENQRIEPLILKTFLREGGSNILNVYMLIIKGLESQLGAGHIS